MTDTTIVSSATAAREPCTPAGRIEVWTLHVSSTPFPTEIIERILSPDEKSRVASLRQTDDRRRYLAAHLGLRAILAQAYGVPLTMQKFVHGPAGKPYLLRLSTESPIYFSLSHSGDVVLIAISREVEVGVDVERMHRELDDDLAATFCSDEELVWLRSLPLEKRMHGCYRLWVCKEAAVKALGSGLTFSPRQLSIDLRSADPLEVCSGVLGSRSWFLRELETESGYAAAVVAAGGARQVERRTLSLTQWLGEIASETATMELPAR